MSRPTRPGGPHGAADQSRIRREGGDETLHQLFVLNVVDFDDGDELGEVRHLIIEARRISDAPPVACYGGHESTGLGEVAVAVLDCPERSDESSANTRHGEGAHTGHLLAYWDVDGFRYVVSVHGKSRASRRLIEELVAEIDLIKP